MVTRFQEGIRGNEREYGHDLVTVRTARGLCFFERESLRVIGALSRYSRVQEFDLHSHAEDVRSSG